MKIAFRTCIAVVVLMVATGFGNCAQQKVQPANLVSRECSVAIRAGAICSLTNRLTDERLVESAGVTWSSELHILDGKSLSMLGEQMSAKKGPGFIEEEVSREDGATLRTKFELEASDIIVTQAGDSRAKGVSGISWAIAEVPNSVSVLVPGDSGQRFGSEAPTGIQSFEYPMHWEAPFVILQAREGGAIIRAEDPRFHFKNLTLEHTGKSFRLRFETRNFAPFSEKTEIRSVKWRITVYKGNWQVGAAIYRQWAEKAYGLTALDRKEPAWASEIRFVVTMGTNIPVLQSLASKVNPIQTLLYIPDWRKDGYDRNYPDYTARPEFADFVEKAHQLGFKVMAHVNYFGCDPKNPLYEKFSKYQLRDPFNGALQWWEWTRANPPIKFAYINPASGEWRKLFVEKMKELVAAYHVDALHLDQTLVIVNDSNGLIDGLTCIEGNIALHRELKEALPHIALSGEGLNEVTCRYEAFAQRHVRGIEFVEGTWNDQQLAMAHPVSSAILLPYTAIYGYLGLPNPDARLGTYLAWQRAYEHYGVIPTLPWPTVEQLSEPSYFIRDILNMAIFFQKYKPVADFSGAWQPNDLFVYQLSDGRQAFYGRDQGVVFGVRNPGGSADIISRRLEGVAEARIGGTVPGWPAYDKERILGLNPRACYPWSSETRNLEAFHIFDMPEGFMITQAGIHLEFARLRIQDTRSGIDLWRFQGKGSSGVRLWDGTVREYPGITFSDPDSGGNVQLEGEGLFAHPPWRMTPGNSTSEAAAVTFINYSLALPKGEKVIFRSGVCLRSGAVGQSDGVTFRVIALCGDERLSAETHHDGADSKPFELDLTPFAGKKITLRLESDPGPAGSPAFDWARFEKPTILVESPERKSIGIVAGDKSLANSTPVASEGSATLVDKGKGQYVLRAIMPGTIVIPFSEPVPLNLPCELLDVKFANHMVLADGIEKPAEKYAKAKIEDAVCAGEARRALYEHPPDMGRTIIDYWLRLPAKRCKLTTAIGIRDGSKSSGVKFEIEANGRQLFSRTLRPNTGWVPVELDLTPWAGQPLMLTFITDSAGDNGFDWAVWAEPRVIEE